MWRTLVIDSLFRPRAAARRLLALDLEHYLVLQAAVSVTCLGILLGYLALRLRPDAIDAVSAAVIANPLLGALAQLAAMAVIAFLTFRVGRLFGGSGGLWGSLALIVWLNMMMVLAQTGQLVALAVLPPLAALLAFATLLWALWAYANFVTELHRFDNPWLVLGGVVLTMVLLFFALAMALSILGIIPQGAG